MTRSKEELIKQYFIEKQNESIHKNHIHSIVIGFAGVPGSGKSSIAKILESRLNALRISTDDIRDYIRENLNGQYPDSQQILAHLIDFISTYKGILIVDGSADRNYTLLNEIAQKYNFRLYIISIQTDHQSSVDRLISRSSQEKEHILIENLSRFEQDHEKFLTNFVPQFSLQHPFDSEIEAENIISDIEV